MYKNKSGIWNSKTHDENVINMQYVRDVYLKDFKYISPKVVNVNQIKKVPANKSLICKSMFRKWVVKVVEGLKQFFYEGSLHGVKYIFEPTFSLKERITWIIIVVISIAICAGVISQLFSKSTSQPFVNVIDSLPTPLWAVPFPAVVVCPHLHVQLSFANVNELDHLHKFFASRICPQMMSEALTWEQRLSPEENIMMMDFIVQGSPKCKDIIKTCYWRGTNQHTRRMTSECCDDYFRPLFTNYGLCFSFNGLPLSGMTNITIPWQKSYNRDAKPQLLEWSLDEGYPKVFPPDAKMLPYRVTASGESNGLGVELFLNASEHQFACDGNSMGFSVIISSPTDHVYTSTVLRIPMDRETTVEVSPITYRTDKDVRSSLSPGQRQCFFQNERKLVYYDFYTDSNCKHDLLLRETIRLCNCVLFNWPREQTRDPICSTTSDFECIDTVNAKVEEQLIYAYFADSEESRRPSSTSTSSSCHPACNDVLYSSQVFYSDLVKEPGNVQPEWGHPTRGELTRLNVHFHDDMFLGQHRHMQYDDYYFIGAIGGLLSLFLGFSIISVAEIFYFVALRPVHAVLKEQFCH